uniref:DUF1249 domain-containing protein n=1 Tax=Sulfuriferula sp. GW6 TaxID=3345112 RepID=UPI0039F6C25D
MAASTIFEAIYHKLSCLIPDLANLNACDARKSQVSGYMDLNLDVLDRDHNTLQIALAHYYEQNGDLVPDPDMEIRVNLSTHEAEALTFQTVMGFTHVYGENTVNNRAKRDLNDFLNTWLNNALAQGYSLDAEKSTLAA